MGKKGNREERKARLSRRQEGEKKVMEKIEAEEARKAAENQTEKNFKDEMKVQMPDPDFIRVVEEITGGYTRNLYDFSVMHSLYNTKNANFSSIEHLQLYQSLIEKINRNINPETGNYLEAYKKIQMECKTPEEVYVLSKMIEKAEEKMNAEKEAKDQADKQLDDR